VTTGGRVFERIAKRYDLLNSILSFGQDQNWRRRVARFLPDGRILDLGGGTGAVNPLFAEQELVTVDPSLEMLALNPVERRVVGAGEQLPFGDDSFDGVFSAYVFRNLDSVPETLTEIARVLRPGGVAGIVDLGRPRGRIPAMVHRASTGTVLPLAGTLIRARDEYSYLHLSLDKLPPPREMFGGGPLRVQKTWRMGPLGFVYGAVLVKD
jgi:demethylmenaquinone methyltransferase/2-methoxy-6-polyprenyl-1,4-benzoquinol methylase